MTIRTTIPYSHGNQFAPSDGPTFCTRCSRSLIDRSPDAKEDSVDMRTNAELVVYVWESEVDAMGHALCGQCSEDDEQAAAYLELAKWRGRAENRGYYSGRGGVTVYEGQVAGPTFELVLGKISSHKVFTFTGRDPLKIQPGLMTMRAMEAWNTEATLAIARGVPGAPGYPQDGCASFGPEDDMMDCPETERNCER